MVEETVKERMSKMTERFLQDIASYKQAIYPDSPVCRGYQELLQLLQKIRSRFAKAAPEYKVGNISPGYLDFSYFPFFDEALRGQLLRFGFVLNHQDMSFELWLMGQNAEVQKIYWQKLKDLKWNAEKTAMPKYTVLETVIEDNPDFSHLDDLVKQLIEETLKEVAAIRLYV